MANGSENLKGKKSILLRLNSEDWNEIAAWAEEEFRSINGQIEYLLNEAIRQRRQQKKRANPHQ